MTPIKSSSFYLEAGETKCFREDLFVDSQIVGKMGWNLCKLLDLVNAEEVLQGVGNQQGVGNRQGGWL